MKEETYIIPITFTVTGKVAVKATNWADARKFVEREVIPKGFDLEIPDEVSIESPFDMCTKKLGFVTTKNT